MNVIFPSMMWETRRCIECSRARMTLRQSAEARLSALSSIRYCPSASISQQGRA